jgi:stage V sporulation protein G
MKITEVQIVYADDRVRSRDRLHGFATITIDKEFRVKDIKILEKDGYIFISMPAKKMTTHCEGCNGVVTVLDKFCCHCAKALNPQLENFESKSVFINTAHPINVACRRYIEKEIADKFNQGSQVKLKVRENE